MKLLSLVLASSSFAQDEGSDKWVGYDYGSYGGYSYGSYGSDLDAKFTHETIDNGIDGRLGNGLTCFTCHGRLRHGAQEDTTTTNAWLDCVQGDGSPGSAGTEEECFGDQRSCLTEERRRNGIVVEVKAGCKNPEACMYQCRRNERYMPFFHHFGDQTDNALPQFFDDECTNTANSKHMNQKSQWESTCRHCCAADTSGTGCNGTDGMCPIGFHCSDGDSCATALDSTNMYNKYSIMYIPAFIDAAMAHGRAHPGEGRNSAPEDKFIQRKDMNGVNLMEQADQLSTEDTDFHNRRLDLTGTNGGAFGVRK